MNGVELEDSYEDLESSDSDDEDNGTTLQELVGKGRGRGRGVSSRNDQAVGRTQLREEQLSTKKEVAVVASKKPAYFPNFDYSKLEKGSWWNNYKDE